MTDDDGGDDGGGGDQVSSLFLLHPIYPDIAPTGISCISHVLDCPTLIARDAWQSMPIRDKHLSALCVCVYVIVSVCVYTRMWLFCIFYLSAFSVVSVFAFPLSSLGPFRHSRSVDSLHMFLLCRLLLSRAPGQR